MGGANNQTLANQEAQNAAALEQMAQREGQAANTPGTGAAGTQGAQ
jgi:hypothetical protein